MIILSSCIDSEILGMIIAIPLGLFIVLIIIGAIYGAISSMSRYKKETKGMTKEEKKEYKKQKVVEAKERKEKRICENCKYYSFGKCYQQKEKYKAEKEFWNDLGYSKLSDGKHCPYQKPDYPRKNPDNPACEYFTRY